jgi:hypothetical protein
MRKHLEFCWLYPFLLAASARHTSPERRDIRPWITDSRKRLRRNSAQNDGFRRFVPRQFASYFIEEFNRQTGVGWNVALAKLQDQSRF